MVNFDTTDDGYTFEFSSEAPDEPASTIAKGVARVKKVDVTELDPLQWTIDVDALNEFIKHNPSSNYRRAVNANDPAHTEANSSGLMVSFRYEGCTITVTNDAVHVVPE